jgi:epoxyqueuosine reductase QueG
MTKNAEQELTIYIKAEARRQGFELVGVTGPEPPPHVDVFQRWLAAGRHAGMAYLASDRARQRRNDLSLILPECQSVLVVAANYLPKITSPSPDPIAGRVAAYAMGEDHHRSASWPTSPAPHIHRYRAIARTRARPTRRVGLDRQEHLSDQP